MNGRQQTFRGEAHTIFGMVTSSNIGVHAALVYFGFIASINLSFQDQAIPH